MGDYRDEREAALKRAENLAQENEQLHRELDALRGGNTSAPVKPPPRATTRMPMAIAAVIGAVVVMGAGMGFFVAVRSNAASPQADVLTLRGAWSPPAVVARVPLRSAVRAGAGTWAVGDRGTIVYRSEGRGPWTTVPSGTDANLHAIASSASLIAVGDRGVALRFDATERRWIAETTGVTADLHAICASGEALFAAGSGGTVLRRNRDGAWARLSSGVSDDLHGIVVSPTSYMVTAVGANGVIVSGASSGDALVRQASPVRTTLRAVAEWNGNLLAVGDHGTIVATTDRSPWVEANSGVSADLFVVGTAEISYEERRGNFIGSGSGTGFVAAGAGGTVLVERLGSTVGWRSVRAGGAAVRTMTADPWTFFTEGGTSIEFSSR